MQRIALRRQQLDNQNNKRWSTSLIDNDDHKEQTSYQSPCLTLLINKLGIPREKAERACVATGYRSAQAATDWLLQRHVDDRLIRTEFIVVLCPDERLHEQIRTFTSEISRYLAKGASVHDRQYLRAFKISSFSHIPDRHAYALHKVFDSTVDEYRKTCKTTPRIVLHTTNDYLMLIPDGESKKTIQNMFDMIKRQFEQIVPTGFILPAKKPFHMTLTHGLSSLFNLSTEQRASLIQLAQLCFEFDRPIHWSLRLYSRERSSLNEIVYRVISPAKEPAIDKCLLLKANDLFMVLDNGRIGEQENVFVPNMFTQESAAKPPITVTTNGSSTTRPTRRFHQRALIWDLEETRALLDLLKDERILKAIESVRTREIYHEISERLKQAGFNRDWNQIRGRVKNLKFSYKKARALHEEQGQSTLTCRFYDDLHQLFGHKYKRQRSKKRSLQQPQHQYHHQQQIQALMKAENEEGEIILNSNEPDDISDDEEESMYDEDDEQRNYPDDVSPDYVQRPEDPYPVLLSTRASPNTTSLYDINRTTEVNDEQEHFLTDEVDINIKSMSPYKHQAYLMDDILQSVFNKFLLAQQQLEQRFTSFINEQRRSDQEREERIHREQREHHLELIQLMINQGRSHTTGEEGLYPLKNLRKTPETDSWTLQRSASLMHDRPSTNPLDSPETNRLSPFDDRNPNKTVEVRHIVRDARMTPRLNHASDQSDRPFSSSSPGLIRLLCIRHGERVDFAFGPSWPELAFDKAGNYRRINLNMPVSLPRRRNPFRDFLADSPITEIGVSQARLTGEALAANESIVQYCYSSPSLRCIQTAHYILQGMGAGDRIKIRVEPGLFEFLGWYERGLPSFFNSTELYTDDDEVNLYNIDKTYRPIISLEKLSRDEKYIDYYNRSFKVTQQITDKHKLTGANILFVGHAATLEVCTRQLCSLPPRSYSDFNGVIRKVSYLGLQLCERSPSDGQWTLKPPPIPALQHANNIAYDWQTMK